MKYIARTMMGLIVIGVIVGIVLLAITYPMYIMKVLIGIVVISGTLIIAYIIGEEIDEYFL